MSKFRVQSTADGAEATIPLMRELFRRLGYYEKVPPEMLQEYKNKPSEEEDK